MKLTKQILADKWYWFVLLIMYGFFFTTMIYADFAVTFEHGVILCEAIFSGRFFEFYDMAVEGVYNNPAVYDIGIYLLWAIWCIPVYVVTRFWHVAAAQTPVLMLYGKVFVVLFHFLTVHLLVKMADVLSFDEKKKRMLVLLFCSSICMVIPTIGNGQFDIIPTYFMMLGVYMFMKGDYGKFLIVMSFAVSFKIFAIFIAVPLVLYKQKKILYIIRDCIALLLASVFFNVLFWGKTTDYYDKLYFHSPDQYTTGWIQRMFEVEFPAGIGNISVFILFFVLLCGYAYFGNKKEGQDAKTAVLFSFLTFLNFFIFIAAHPQWIVLLIPFVYLIAMCRESHYRFNLVLATLIDIMFFVCMSYRWYNVFWSSNEFKGLEMLIPFPENQRMGGSLKGFIDMLGFGYIYPGLMAVLVALCLVFIYQVIGNNDTFREIEEKNFEKRMMVSRLAFMGVHILSLLLLAYV